MLASVRELLDGKGFTLGQVHRGTGISKPYLSLIFSGQRTPRVPVASAICVYLGIRLDELYKVIGKG